MKSLNKICDALLILCSCNFLHIKIAKSIKLNITVRFLQAQKYKPETLKILVAI